MKVNLTKEINNGIDGYKNILYIQNNIDLNELFDNEAEIILANEILDYFSIDNIKELVYKVCGKLRLNGKLIIGGTDLSLFCKMVSNDLIDKDTANKYLQDRQSMVEMSYIKSLLESVGLKIETFHYSGMTYEITAIRN
jgi:hypothetical protein